MIRGALTSNLDVAQVVLYAFFVFFAGLIFYLRREDRREGYPLESEAMGRPKARGFLLVPTPKTFFRPGGATVLAPKFDVDPRVIRATKVAPWPGAPLEPDGDPMRAEVGPGAYALRADVPEKLHDGRDLIVPMRVATNFTVAKEDGNPLGMRVFGVDGVVGGVVTDLWVDRGESILRYYEVETATDGPSRRVLLPVTFARVEFSAKLISVDALLGRQFAGVPTTRDPDRVTMLEEEKITAYFGAGTLYATPQRSEPLI
jgi:photosynthetic reaction center H subunit